MANDLNADLETFSIQEARQIALAAQGFAEPRPKPGTVTIDDLDRVMNTVNIVQIDTINVLVRTQYMPFFSRLGPYSQEMLHKYAYEDRNLFEYYAHAASLTPISHLPFLRHRMAEWKPWRRWNEIMDESPGLLDSMIDEIRANGPMEVADFDNKGQRYGYWGTSTTKLILETLMFQGTLTTADRKNSARRYDFIERVAPESILNIDIPRDEAHRQMMKLAISSLGVATDQDLADYYRIRRAEAQAAIKSLLEQGEIQRVEVEGVDVPTYALPDIAPPSNPLQTCAIVSPFDSVAWFRDRLERFFDFYYKIEIYVPPKKRRYGYYVMPFILGDRFAARVDLKADRQKSILRVPGAFLEDDSNEDETAHHLAAELRQIANWLNLNRIVVGRRGNLIPALRSAVKAL